MRNRRKYHFHQQGRILTYEIFFGYEYYHLLHERAVSCDTGAFQKDSLPVCRYSGRCDGRNRVWRQKEQGLSDDHKQIFTDVFEKVSFTDSAAMIYGKIRHLLEKEGRLIGPNDLLIAATVMADEGVLVTNNTKEFERIPNLRLENWTF